MHFTHLFLPQVKSYNPSHYTTASSAKMPGLHTPHGQLGKRKRMGDAPEPSASTSFKSKTFSCVLSDQMALDGASHHSGLVPPSAYLRRPLPHCDALEADLPPRSRRKLAQPRASRHDTSPADSTTSTTSLLIKTSFRLPCHRCHKAPLQKKDLESYTDCVRCEQRTCTVCLRQCGCQRKICADCSVEEGVEGDVYCLDCFGKIQDDGSQTHTEAWKDLDREMNDG